MILAISMLIIYFPQRTRNPEMNTFTRKIRPLSQNNSKRRRNKLKLETTQSFQPQAYEKFLSFLTKRRKQFLKERLTEYYGKNFPVNYKQHYQFQQQWENKLAAEAAGNYKGMNDQNKLQIAISIVTILVLTTTIWFSNIQFFIRGQGKSALNELIYSLAIVIQCMDLLLRVRKQASQRTIDLTLFEYLEISIKNLVCTLFLGLKLAQLEERDSVVWVIFEIISLYLMYSRASQLYQSLRLMNFSLHYEYQTKVIDLVITLILIAHFISLLMFSATKLDFETSWLSALHIDETNQFIVYIYSFYFCATTILTVGYGDISPKNPAEVAIVTMVEIFGIVMFAYIINEIGYSISSLRKDRQIIEKDLSIVEKMRMHYNMEDNLANRTRSYIINHKPKIDQLSPSEENGIMIKLNEELRLQISKKNMQSVVKNSIFFLCRWSKVFQSAISLKLNHILFNPNDVIYQPLDKERIYIIKSGKINIYAQKKGGKKGMNNLLKTIERKASKEISNNCYGYTAVISSRPVKLYAIAKQFTTSYFIEKQKFLECINERQCDFEYYHEIKSKIDQSFHSESIQVPTLESSKHHYSPTKVCLIRKYCNIQNTPNQRENYKRCHSLIFRGRKFLMDQETIRQARHVFISSMDSNNYETTQNIANSGAFKIQINEQDEDIASFIMANEIKSNFAHYFESSKQYSNYFPKNNKFQILKKYENEYCLPKGNEQEIMQLSSQMYKAARTIRISQLI